MKKTGGFGMHSLGLVVAGFLLVTPSVFAAQELETRSMPDSCEFVYRIETDFKLTYQESAIPPDSQVQVIYAFEDGYGEQGHWLDEHRLPMQSAQGLSGTWKVDFLEESMSTHLHRIFREINFYYEITLSTGEVQRVPAANQGPGASYFHADFSRQFGDRCSPNGRNGTPFVKRAVDQRKF